MQIYPLSVGVNNDHLLVPEVADDLGIEGEGPEEEGKQRGGGLIEDKKVGMYVRRK